MKRNLFIFLFSTAFVNVIIYPAIWWFSLGGYQVAEHWLRPVMEAKKLYAKSINARKIIIAAGSNSLFGIDSQFLSELTDFPVVNLSGHAEFTFSFLADQILQVAGRGDVVVMPLEYSYYKRASMLNNWQIKNMTAWGADHVKTFSCIETMKYFLGTSAKDTFLRLFSKLKNKEAIRYDIDKVLFSLKKRTEMNDLSWQGYSYKSMNLYGDLLVDHPPTENLVQSDDGFNYITDGSVSDEFVKNYHKLENVLSKKGVKLILTWPVSVSNEAFNLERPADRSKIVELEKNLAMNGIDIHCEAQDFHYPISYFFNTSYHLNYSGAIDRTKKLSICINHIVKNDS